MVVAMTPRTSNGPVALSATTTPITVFAVIAPPSPRVDSSARSTTNVSAQAVALTSVAAFPHAITPGPQLDLDGTDIAAETPADSEMVFLRTEAVTYRLRWDEACQLTVPDGSVVFDTDGDLVARVEGGDLVSLVGG